MSESEKNEKKRETNGSRRRETGRAQRPPQNESRISGQSELIYSKIDKTVRKSDTFASEFQSFEADFENDSAFDYSIFE